jgi:glycosyltransferase involved in cell wall biosynthesis
MKVSIITINYNNALGLDKTLKSVFSQSNKNYEYLIIDGGSTDTSTEIIKQHSKKISYWVSERDSGIYNAMNKGIAKATGEYLVFLNSGDCFSEPETLQRCHDHIAKHPSADIYYGDIFVVNDKSQHEKWLKVHPVTLSLSYFKFNTINHQASLIKSQLFSEINHYPENYKVASDYWFFLKCLLSDKKFAHMSFAMVNYDLTGISFCDYDNYKQEKKLIWESLVPQCVQDITTEYEECKANLKKLLNFKMVRAAISFNERYQSIKRCLS